MKTKQRGGTILGFILGLLVGLGAALAVAVYVTKVPVPFLTKSPTKDTEAAEAERNKNWDPNSPLYGKNPAKGAVTPSVPAATGVEPAPSTPAVPPTAAEVKKAENKPETKLPPATGAPSADPLGDLANAKVKASDAKQKAGDAKDPKAAGNDGFDYFVQAGAFRTQADADAQRAKLAMLGWEARVSEREQNGRTVFRVRVGPFGKRDDAEQLQQKLVGAGVDSALVRVQR